MCYVFFGTLKVYCINGYRIYVDIMTREKLLQIFIGQLEYPVEGERWGKGVGWRVSLFLPSASITLLEYIKIWCYIQVIIYPTIIVLSF